MRTRKGTLPTYSLHKATGAARVRIGKKTIWLGRYGTDESKQRYAAVLSDWQAGRARPEVKPAPDLTISELVYAYMRFVEGRYQKAGRQTSQVSVIKSALAPLVKLSGGDPVAGYSPRRLLELRDWYIRDGQALSSANRNTGLVRRMFRWGVSRELVPLAVSQSLATVEGLREGQILDDGQVVQGSQPVRPATREAIRASGAKMCQTVRDMMDLQLLTAMRPGEVLAMRWSDIDRTVSPWLYRIRPERDKTAHDHTGMPVPIGGAAQAILAKYTDTPPLQPIFAYDVQGYRYAIRAACDKANQEAIEEAKKQGITVAGRLIERFTPHQLRHTRLTEIRAKYGVETSRTVGRHSTIATNELYAERDLERAVQVAREVG